MTSKEKRKREQHFIPEALQKTDMDELALLFMQGSENGFADIYLRYRWPVYLYVRFWAVSSSCAWTVLREN